MESIESIVNVYNFSKNLFTCRNSIKTRKRKLKLRSPQNARAFKHGARHVQELCNSLSDTSGGQSPGNVIYKRNITQRFSRYFLFMIWWQLIDK